MYEMKVVLMKTQHSHREYTAREDYMQPPSTKAQSHLGQELRIGLVHGYAHGVVKKNRMHKCVCARVLVCVRCVRGCVGVCTCM